MKRLSGIISFLLLLTVCALKPDISTAQQSCASLTTLKLADTTITSATALAAGPFQPTSTTQAATGTSFDLPAFCRVSGSIKPTPDSDIRFEVWLPASGWNDKFLQLGNGGLAGSIGYANLTAQLQNNYATAATDDGHQSSGIDGSWAIGHPEKVKDFGYRAVHGTSVVAKAIIRAFYGRAARHSYFSGASEGGREALIEAQQFPDDFDGILAGCPGNNWIRLLATFIWNSQALLKDPASYIPQAKRQLIQSATVAACDGQDGVSDGLISDPQNCHFDPASLKCKGADAVDCLTGAQVAALKKIYAGPRSLRTGTRIGPGYEPGAEAEPGRPGISWASYVFGPTAGQSLDVAFGTGFFSGMVFEDPKWDFRTFDFDRDLQFAIAKLSPILDATNPDLTRFKARGGKLIQYHGWLDGSPPPGHSVEYYERVAAKSRGLKNTQTFYRLFMVPGMMHCSGGPGPNNFGNTRASGPQGLDPDRNIFVALERWVERGTAPDKIIATKYVDDDPKKGVTMTRPLCPYPQQARWTGKGSTDDATNFVCRPPSKQAKAGATRGQKR